MRFSSTNNSNPPVGLSEAIARCVAPDGGMFMPEFIPKIPKAFFNNISELSIKEIAFIVTNTFFGSDVDAISLKKIVDESFAFDAVFRKLKCDIYVLELFHGPTLTFKDYGARFMARLLNYLDKNSNSNRNVLVATTGNTGAAAANGFYRMPGTNVIVLYPKGQLNRSQLSQLTALGENIYPLEIIGTIEDCKRLVQDAIAHPSFADLRLTGANSINVARLIPQITFSLFAYSRLKALKVGKAEEALYFIPTGNMSNVVAAVMAQRMGCPIGGVVAAVGANNQVSAVLNGKNTEFIQKPIKTIAPAIDMSYPSGWPRLEYLFKGNKEALRNIILSGHAVSDNEISDAIVHLFNDLNYSIDTHGAVAYCTALQYASTNAPKVIFATGHPARQIDIITKITGRTIELPVQLTRFMAVRRPATVLAPTLPALRKFLFTI